MYGGLYLVDVDLVMPPALAAAIPWWLNQAMHSVSAVQVAVQLLAEPLSAPPTVPATVLASAITAAYTAV